MEKKKLIVLIGCLGVSGLLLLGLVASLLLRSPQAQALVPEQTPAPAADSPVPEETLVPEETAAPFVTFSFGPVETTVTELVPPALTEGDVALLSELTNLTLLDGRACADYSLLQQLSATAPYRVLWSVPLGNQRVDGDTTVLTVPAEVTEAAAVEQALLGLPQVERVDLRESGLDNQQIAQLKEQHPDLEMEFYVLVQGIRDSADQKVLELNVSDIVDWDALARELGYLKELEQIIVTGDLSLEQATFLLEGAGTTPVTYSVAFEGQSVSSEATKLDASELSPNQLGELKAVLSVLPKVTLVNLEPATHGSSWTLDEADQVQAFREGLKVNYKTSAFGVSFSLADEVVAFSGKNLKRKVEELKLLLPYLRNVQKVEMISCGIDNETMAALKAEFPTPKLVWRVKVGGYSCRTDSIMLKLSAAGDRTLTDSDVGNLKYCTDVKYLDLGHNKLHHMPFVAYMPDLEVCIMYNPMHDLDGIENCPKLEYFECFSCTLKNIEPLAACTELKHLNLTWTNTTDITPLYGLTKLERLWISRNDIPADQLNTFRELVPDCIVNTTAHNPTSEGWREDENGDYVPRYALLREQFKYDETETRSY
ncbi:MAG: hypothetical protein IJR17_06965 [Clostridia bacterium]|nr:hypothetical protein [Clostridia bacterium]